MKRIIIIMILCFCFTYVLGIIYYKDKFLPNTYINKIDVSNLAEEDAVKIIEDNTKNSYTLTIQELDNKEEIIKGNEIELNAYADIKSLIAQQDNILWIISFFKSNNYNLVPKVDFNEELLIKKIESLGCIKYGKNPMNAYISEYIKDKGYEIIKEDNGSLVNKDSLIGKVQEKIRNLEGTLDLENEDCYERVTVTSNDSSLIEVVEQLNSLLATKIIYIFGNDSIVLDANTYYLWIVDSEDGLSINKDEVLNYVDTLANQTDTVYTTRIFVTTSGESVNVQGPYGYQINKAAEVEQIIIDIESRTEVTREPIYKSKGDSRHGYDYGNTYVEVNLTNQMVYLYVDGQLIKTSKCVTGNVSKGHTTPAGIFPLTYKQKDKVLRGPDYASPVKFWMPFNGGIGLHDASWRNTFGGTIYKTNGSHGCVNLPYDMAKTLYESVYSGMPVICY